jgi:hypothetical protein
MEYDILVVKWEEVPVLVDSLERAMHSHRVLQSNLLQITVMVKV